MITSMKRSLRRLFCKEQGIKWAVLLILGLGLLGFRVLGITCLWLELLHVPCPGCGFTRACGFILQGKPAAAWAYHPMFWSAPLLVLQYFADGKLFRREILNRCCFWLLAGGFGAAWLLRLLFDGFPFWHM